MARRRLWRGALVVWLTLLAGLELAKARWLVGPSAGGTVAVLSAATLAVVLLAGWWVLRLLPPGKGAAESSPPLGPADPTPDPTPDSTADASPETRDREPGPTEAGGEVTVSRAELDEVLDTVAGSLFLVSVEHTIERVNRSAARLLGYRTDELRGVPFEAVCGSSDQPRAPLMLRLAVEGHLRGAEQLLRRRDGTAVPVSVSGSALRGAQGDVVGFVCVAHDLSEQKKVEQTIRDSLRRKETLLREVHHRVKNNLQVILSLLDLQSRRFAEREVREIFAESHNRIQAMALIHEQLYRAPNMDQIDIRSYIETLALQVLESYGVRSDRVALRFDLEQHPIDPDRAVLLGLVVNELVVNALKHAFPAEQRGRIEVSFGATPDGDRLALTVADNGRGIAEDEAGGPAATATESLGLKLVASLSRQLRGSLELLPAEGTRLRVEFPVASPEAPSYQ